MGRQTKIRLLGAAALMLAPQVANADPIPGLFNTGVDSAGHALSVGASDLHYTVGGATPVVSGYNYPNAYPAGANFITSGLSDIGPYSYSLSFDLTGLDSSTASLSGLFASDDSASVYLNGILLASTPPAGFSVFTAFTASSGFLAGLNTLNFATYNTGGPEALGVANLTGSARALSGTVPAVPEPGTWAMMLAGFGMIGFAARRRQSVKTSVRFA